MARAGIQATRAVALALRRRMVDLVGARRHLERDDKKWEPVFVKKSRDNKDSGS